MSLLYFLPIAGFTCLSAVVAKAYDETINLRSEFERELNIFDDAQLEQRQFLNPNRVTKSPTKRPTKRSPTKRPTRRPTKRPTRRPTGRPASAATLRPTKRPTKKPTASVPAVTDVEIELPARPFRLRLYWKDSYKWQNLSSDPMFCMECSGSGVCFASNVMYVKGCSTTAKDQQFIAIGNTIRPYYDQSLCFTVVGYGGDVDTDGDYIPRAIEIQRCEVDDENQEFLIRSFVGSSFEISPVKRPDKCLASAHHPKLYEKIHPKGCLDSRGDTTSSWVTF